MRAVAGVLTGRASPDSRGLDRAGPARGPGSSAGELAVPPGQLSPLLAGWHQMASDSTLPLLPVPGAEPFPPTGFSPQQPKFIGFPVLLGQILKCTSPSSPGQTIHRGHLAAALAASFLPSIGMARADRRPQGGWWDGPPARPQVASLLP